MLQPDPTTGPLGSSFCDREGVEIANQASATFKETGYRSVSSKKDPYSPFLNYMEAIYRSLLKLEDEISLANNTKRQIKVKVTTIGKHIHRLINVSKVTRRIKPAVRHVSTQSVGGEPQSPLVKARIDDMITAIKEVRGILKIQQALIDPLIAEGRMPANGNPETRNVNEEANSEKGLKVVASAKKSRRRIGGRSVSLRVSEKSEEQKKSPVGRKHNGSKEPDS